MERVEVEPSGRSKLAGVFSCSTIVLVNFVVWLLLTSLSLAALIHTLVHSSRMPDFTEPHKGFETRGTVLAGRANALDNLAEASSRPSRFVTGNPLGLKDTMHPEVLRSWSKGIDAIKGVNGGRVHTHTVMVSPENATRRFPAAPAPIVDDAPERIREEEEEYDVEYGAFHNHSHLDIDNFCGQPTWGHARLVVAHINEGKNLLTLDSVHELCQLQEGLKTLYSDICEVYEPNMCCPVWSLPSYAALYANHTSCHSITQEDLDGLLELMRYCSPFFHDLALECMPGQTCQFAPQRCLRLSIVRSLMDFVLDAGFLPPNASEKHLDVRYMQMVLPVARSIRSYDFYLHLQSLLAKSNFHHIKVVAMDLGLKDYMFDKLLVRDSALLGFASLCLVSVLLLAFVRSPTIVLLSLLNTLFSLVLSYWIYCEVMGVERFPFLNLLAGLLLLAVGTDDVLFIAQGWGERCDKKLHERLRGLNSLWMSVAATSLTTAFAMFAARLSSVTSVALFSIFAGSLMLVHLVMTMMWLLPSMVLIESFCKSCTGLSLPISIASILHRVDSQLKAGLLWVVTRLPSVCVVVMVLVTLCASYMTMVNPKLQAPDSKNFALFHRNHPFERYESQFSESFWFEKRQRSARDILSLTWVWGIVPVDTRDPLDLQARPNASAVIFDDSFDISKPKAQMFLLRFCRQLKQQSFYKPTLGPLLPNCFLETLINYMSRRCYDPFGNIDRKPCCESSKFPYSASVFSLCLQKAMKDLHNTPARFFMPGLAGPKYVIRTNISERTPPQAIVVQFDSSHEFSLSHKTMHEFYAKVEEWTQKMLRIAPRSMRNGFFISDLQFYDLQDHLMSDSLMSVLVAAGICSLVLYLATRNLVVTLLAALCVCSTVLTSLAILAMLDWRLNVLESLVVTMASGLSIDYVLHYAIKYNAHLERDLRIKYLVHKNVSPISVAALTTLATGLILLTSDVLAFNQIGTFIIILSTNSFIFANFGFLSLLFKFGPSFETDLEFCRRVWTVSELQDEANVTSQAPLSDSNSVTLTGLPPLSPELHEMENMSPTFLEDPSAPHTSVFDTPVVSTQQDSQPTKTQRKPEISILEPLLQSR